MHFLTLLAKGKTGTTMVIFRSKWLARRRETRENGITCASFARNTIRQQGQNVKRTLLNTKAQGC